MILLFLFLLAVGASEISDHWALLVAGSSGFVNYRHQADVCHAYHLLLDQGIPQEQIIVMAYDDVVWDDENPVPGKLFNKQDGKDVYQGCKLDYSHKDVHAQNFIAIMKGDEQGLNLTEGSNSTKRVLKSDQNTKLFLYFSDHGAPGHLMFPDTVIYADQLNDTIKFMSDNKMYDEFVIFLEACESGSMFQHIDLESMNAWALTATNSTSPSYGTYCYPHDMIQGENFYTCLGDLFSVSWMEYLENNKDALRTMSLHQFYQEIKTRTSAKSDVLSFGASSIEQKQVNGVLFPQKVQDFFLKFFAFDEPNSSQEDIWPLINSIGSRDIYMHHLYSKAQNSASRKLKLELMKELGKMMMVDEVFASFLDTYASNLHFCREKSVIVDGSDEEAECLDEFVPKDFECLRSLIDTYENNCGRFDDYSRKFVKYLVRECENPTMTHEEAKSKLQKACAK